MFDERAGQIQVRLLLERSKHAFCLSLRELAVAVCVQNDTDRAMDLDALVLRGVSGFQVVGQQDATDVRTQNQCCGFPGIEMSTSA